MDELTSTALARGIAKMLRQWTVLGRREEVLILFHGYNDSDRFGSEVAAASYRLPWLSPSLAHTEVTIKAVGSVAEVAVQNLDGMWPRASE